MSSCRRGSTPPDLSGKREARRALLEATRSDREWRERDRPVIGVISRLTDQKGFDLIAAAAGDLMALDATWTMLAQRRAALREPAARAGGPASGPRLGDDRLRRTPGAPHRGGRRHLPDAVAVRALRPEPAVQPALRHRAGRAGHRRFAGHRRSTPPSPAATASSSAITSPDALVAALTAGARRRYADKDGVGQAPARRHGPGLLLGRFSSGVCQSV